MGGPTNNCPLGVGANCPSVNAGTLARTPHSPSTVKGQKPVRLAKAAPILASFDSENAVIWANKALLTSLSDSRNSGKPLRDTDVATLAHEFIHVWQYKDVFEKFSKREERAAEMIKRHAALVAKVTEDQYVQHVLGKEKQAEKLAQRIVVEMLSHFSRSRGGSGFPSDQADFLAEERAKQWIRGLRKSYADKARRAYRKLRSKVKEHGGAQGVARASAKKKKTTQKMLPVAKIQNVFPVSKSPTLKKLVWLMVKYNIMIVVSLSQEDI